MPEPLIVVEVVYLDPEQQWVKAVRVVEGSSVMDAVMASGAAAVVPGGQVDPERLGIYSRRVPADQIVQAGDRIEIYRPLQLDPMEARRRRAR